MVAVAMRTGADHPGQSCANGAIEVGRGDGMQTRGYDASQRLPYGRVSVRARPRCATARVIGFVGDPLPELRPRERARGELLLPVRDAAQ